MRRRRSIPLSILAAAIVVAAITLLPTPTSFASQAREAAPPTTDLTIPGLREPVEVRRDRWGVPHIYARNQHDLFLAQGFVAAQDRLFQMEMWRRHGEGRLAEVLGPSAFEMDRASRLFAYRGDMEREWTAYARDTKEIVEAFVAGVNAYISLAGDSLPPEFGLLGFRPEPWANEVPLARATGLSGVSNAFSEVLRAALVDRLGKERVETLMPADPARPLDPVPGVELAGIDYKSLGTMGNAFADVAYNRIEGSNNWVVSGRKTATGRPILANDPHRVITNPAVRYITHLVAPGWNVIGAGEPASPGVAIGHNERIAFGLTVVGMDQQDVYLERLGPCPEAGPQSDPLGCYFHKEKWAPVTSIAETIRVKGEAPRSVVLRFTVHGPVVSVDTARKRAIAIRGIHGEPGTASYLASLSLDRAQNWKEFQEAMTRWLMPSENMIYADVDGNIGWVAGGIMPKRTWSGLLPVPGDGRFEWDGFVPGMELPRAYNPPDGFIATSNHNILPPNYPIALSYEWASRYRIDRVKEVLRQDQRFTVSDFAKLQHDDKSKLAEALVPRLVAAARARGAAARPEVVQLAAWDFRMARNQIAPTIFSAWAPAAYRRAVGLVLSGQPDATKLLAERPEYEWFEDFLAEGAPSTASAAVANGDSLLVAALDDAVADLTKRFGADREKWRWGLVHTATFRHALTSRFDLPAASRSGDGNTVNMTGGRDFRQTAGASFREIIDLSDFDRSLVTNVPGQSADPRSKHYSDLLKLWGNDQYFPLVYSRQRVEQETESVLWLKPAK